MAKRSILCGLVLLCALIPFTSVAGEAPDTVTLTLAKGDPAAGRVAFLALSCSSCHRVEGDTEFPAPVSAEPGPALGRVQGWQSPARLAESIIDPSHDLTGALQQPREDKLSPMGDYSQAMTVRQLLDLIAYMRSLADQEEPGTE